MAKKQWTESVAREFLSKNGHAVGSKEVKLKSSAGIRSFGCADYLKTVHNYSIFYSTGN